jgi:hypothetical protein
MFNQAGGYGFAAPLQSAAPPQTYQPIRQVVQPRPQPVAVKQQPKPKPIEAAPVTVPAPEQLGIHLDDPPVVVPTPVELGIDL